MNRRGHQPGGLAAGTREERLARLVNSAMRGLSSHRPLFHSEADFQLALAWEIQGLQHDAEIRLERRVLVAPVVALDVLVAVGSERYALELKYLKARLDVDISGEPFRLREGAPDVERYDFLRDVARLERVVSEGLADAGCALVLTNAAGFWRPGGARATGFDQFRIHESRALAGVHAWGPTASAGTRRGREAPIELGEAYECHWQPYSTVATGAGGELRYLALIVGGQGRSS